MLGVRGRASVLIGLGLGACGPDPYAHSSGKVLALAAEHPGDDDLQFLALPYRDVDANRALAERTHAPLHLARLVDALSGNWQHEDDAIRDELAERCSDWERADPGNGMPTLVRAKVELHRGHLDLALSLWKEASRKERVDDLTEETRRKTWAIFRAHGIQDVACYPLVLRSNGHSISHLLDAAKALATCGDEYRHRRRYDEAADCYEAVLRIAERFQVATRDVIGTLGVGFLRSIGASSLAELALMRGEREAAEGFIALCEQNGRMIELVGRANRRARDADPLWQLGADLDLREFASGPSRTELKFEQRLRREAADLRPYFETRVKVGECALYQGYLTAADREEAQKLRAEEHALLDLYPVVYGEAERRALIDSLRNETLRSWAIRALIHRRGHEAVPELKGLLAAAGGDSERAREYAFALACQGASESDAVRVLVASLQEPWGVCTVAFRGLAATSDAAHVEAILAELRSATAISDQEKRISACFALRDLTGADHGVDPEAWSAWYQQSGRATPVGHR
jgi:tetratricopeptide (TPR) repeat protein